MMTSNLEITCERSEKYKCWILKARLEEKVGQSVYFEYSRLVGEAWDDMSESIRAFYKADIDHSVQLYRDGKSPGVSVREN